MLLLEELHAELKASPRAWMPFMGFRKTLRISRANFFRCNFFQIYVTKTMVWIRVGSRFSKACSKILFFYPIVAAYIYYCTLCREGFIFLPCNN
jgi:hypothetical protein